MWLQVSMKYRIKFCYNLVFFFFLLIILYFVVHKRIFNLRRFHWRNKWVLLWTCPSLLNWVKWESKRLMGNWSKLNWHCVCLKMSWQNKREFFKILLQFSFQKMAMILVTCLINRSTRSPFFIILLASYISSLAKTLPIIHDFVCPNVTLCFLKV